MGILLPLAAVRARGRVRASNRRRQPQARVTAAEAAIGWVEDSRSATGQGLWPEADSEQGGAVVRECERVAVRSPGDRRDGILGRDRTVQALMSSVRRAWRWGDDHLRVAAEHAIERDSIQQWMGVQSMAPQREGCLDWVGAHVGCRRSRPRRRSSNRASGAHSAVTDVLLTPRTPPQVTELIVRTSRSHAASARTPTPELRAPGDPTFGRPNLPRSGALADRGPRTSESTRSSRATPRQRECPVLGRDAEKGAMDISPARDEVTTRAWIRGGAARRWLACRAGITVRCGRCRTAARGDAVDRAESSASVGRSTTIAIRGRPVARAVGRCRLIRG